MAVVDAEDVTPGSGRVYQRRRHARVTVKGSVRLVADTSAGVVTLNGTIIDLSVSGCAIRVYGRLEPQREARLELQVGGDRVWVPGQIVWTRTRDRSWVVGVKFERLVPDKQSLITRLVAERSRNGNTR
jgi:c-di-GMP-binding flagellar brake protein YcgR